MTVNSFHLPSKIYSYLSVNQNRVVPFQELCIFVYPAGIEVPFLYDSSLTETEYQALVMEMLLFLSDLNLITLNQATDESCINLWSRN